jgi:predicted sulfurtransferase
MDDRQQERRASLSLETSTPKIDYLTVDAFAEIVMQDDDDTVIIDTRSMLEYNTSHVINAYHVNTSKMLMRRLDQEKVTMYSRDKLCFCFLVVIIRSEFHVF